MRHAVLLAPSLTLLLAAVAAAGDRVSSVFQNSGSADHPFLANYDLDSGGVLLGEPLDLALLTPFPFPRVQGVGRIGGETWVATVDGVLRFGGDPLSYLGRTLQGESVLGLFPHPTGALCQLRFDVAVELDPAGNEVIRRAYTESILDLEPIPGGAVITTGTEVLVTDANLDPIGPLSPTLSDDIAAALGIPFFAPRDITRLADGRYVLFGAETVLLAADLSFEREISTTVGLGLGEGVLVATGTGLIATLGFLGHALTDPESGDTIELIDLGLTPAGRRFNTLPFHVNGAAPAGRGCSALPNSTGTAARMHLIGSAEFTDGALVAGASGLPSGTFALPILGFASFDAPFGDGRLCVSPFAPGLVRGTIQRASTAGLMELDYDFRTQGLGGSFAPGLTIHTQVLYRDGGGASGFNATDAVFVTFAP